MAKIVYCMDRRKPCKCSAQQIDRYLARISGPLPERMHARGGQFSLTLTTLWWAVILELHGRFEQRGALGFEDSARPT